jgi:hypothetical protein
MKTYKIIAKLVFIISATMLIVSCEKDTTSDISGKLVDATQDFVQGDSVYLTIEIDGGEPPFAFRYSYYGYNSQDEVWQTIYRNIIDIPERQHTFALLVNDSVTINAESVASYYENVGPAVGEATFNMIPVEYVYEETLPASKTGFMQKSTNTLNFTSGNLQLKNDGSAFERRVFLEFDAADIVNKQEKSNYFLNFWIVSSHSQGVNAGPGLMEVAGWLGPLDDAMTWDDQPQGVELTPLFEKNFRINAADEKLQFSEKINELAYSALKNSSSNKFCIRIKENLNGVGNKGYYFIGGNLYSDETYRPSIDVYLREIIE